VHRRHLHGDRGACEQRRQGQGHRALVPPAAARDLGARLAIKAPRELEGKKLAISPGNSHQVLWPVFESCPAQAELGDVGHAWTPLDAAGAHQGRHRRGAVFVVHEARSADRPPAERRRPRADRVADLGSISRPRRSSRGEDTIAKDPDGLQASCAPAEGRDYRPAEAKLDEGVGYVVKAPSRGRSRRRPSAPPRWRPRFGLRRGGHGRQDASASSSPRDWRRRATSTRSTSS